MLTKLVKSNFRNDLSHMISFVLIVILSSYMLQLGICIVMGYDSHFDNKAKELNLADVTLTCYPDYFPDSDKEVTKYLDTHPEVDYYELNENAGTYCEVIYNEEAFDSQDTNDREECYIYWGEYEEWGDISIPRILEKSDKQYDNPLYISYNDLNNTLHGRFKIGDEILIKIDDVDHVFTIAGIFENLAGSNPVYVSSADYVDLMKRSTETERTFDIKLDPGTDTEAFVKEVIGDFNSRNVSVYYSSLPEKIKDSTYMIDIISSILCVFAVVITLVVVSVIYFRISNSIEQNIVNLGALKALGYTGRQLRHAQILEFVITSTFGFLVSTIALYISLPILEESLLRDVTGSKWEPPFNLIAFLITGAFIVGSTFFVSYLSSSRISKIDPVTAIRFGLKSHSFKKNRFPVETTSGPIIGILSLKSAFRNRKQNILVMIIMAVVGITLSVSIFFTYNIAYKTINLYKLLMDTGAESSFYFSEEIDPEEVAGISGVDKAWVSTSFRGTVKGSFTTFKVADDWTYIPNVNMVDGRVPVLSNEIAVGKVVAERNDIEIGDEVEVACSGIGHTYVVSGICQSTENFGDLAMMSTDGLDDLHLYCSRSCIDVTFTEPNLESSQQVTKEIYETYGDKLRFSSNIYDYLAEGNDVDIMVSKVLSIIFIAVSIVIIFLSMGLLVKTIIIRNQKEIGIKKSLGFTSFQLRLELALSLTPHIVIGLAIGSIFGVLNANRFLGLILRVLGIYKSTLETLPWMPVLSIVSGTALAFILILFFSHKIRKISAYSLIRE